MNKSLAKNIDAYLADRRESDGGYAKITDEDINNLYEIIYKIIELKCEPDPDGDRPIHVTLVDQSKYELPPYFIPVRHRHDIETNEELEERFEDMLSNLKSVADRVDTESKIRKNARRALQRVSIRKIPQFELVRPIEASVEQVDKTDKAHIASFYRANINASGDTREEAIENLKEMIVSTYNLLNRKEAKLSEKTKRQLAILKDYIYLGDRSQ